MADRPWIGSPSCRSHVHCHACRRRPDFRAKLARAWQLPDRDFACPEGFTPEDLPQSPVLTQPPSRGLGDTIARLIHWLSFGRVRPCGGCRRRQAFLNWLWPYNR